MAYWISASLSTIPALVWMFFGVGLVWSLAVLPRKDWSDRVLVVCVSLALGPAVTTAWMFILGTLGAAQNTPLLRFDLIFGGTVLLAIIGALLAWHKKTVTVPDSTTRHPVIALKFDEKLLIALIAIALLIRWFTTAYWPFNAYDELWVYGYEGRLYTLVGSIPQRIGYYPQFIPLQYTYAQLAVGGVNDHAARAVIPFLHVGSILAVYVLGARLFNRRAGLFAAALWALYPHVGEWAHVGDLEIPQTFLLTLTAAFFLMAWLGHQPRRRYAVIAGLVYGIALWTKPTAGAFIWGVLLLLLIELIRLRLDRKRWLPRFEVAFITGLAAVPLGGVWYIRNILLGHRPIDLPDAFWLTQAQRSGAEFGWPFLALILLLGYVYLGPLKARPNLRGGLIGLILILAGLSPSIVTPHRMGLLEWAALAAGTAILAITLKDFLKQHVDSNVLVRNGWMLALALPYFVTWFYSYSYHYRLSFAIVPLMLTPSAVVLACWLTPERIKGWRMARRFVYLTGIVLLGLPGAVITLHDYGGGWDWLWTDKYPDDWQRYASENPSLMMIVWGLQHYIDTHSTPPVVVAPGAQLLPFFFPLADIRNTEAPTRLDQLEGATHYVYSKHAGWLYEEQDVLPSRNQVVGALERGDLMQRVAAHDDGNFFYELYELSLEKRFKQPELSFVLDEEVVFGGFLRYVGANLHSNVFHGENRIRFEIGWQVLAQPDRDYMIYLHLLNQDDGKVWATWDAPIAEGQHGYYSSLFWEPGEYIFDVRFLQLQDPDTPPGRDYRVIVGLYDLETGERVPLTIDGQPAGDGFDVRGTFTVR